MTTQGSTPWYRRTLRWGQTNLTEGDPRDYDTALWRGYWRRTQTQGVIVNAGGIVAYYPSHDRLHHRAEHLGDRDLFGEIVEAARTDGLSVLARMDSNRARQPFFDAHPDWFAVDRDGKPYRAGEFYFSCIHGPYYREYLAKILEEIIDRYHPDGFADNSWCGLGRDKICYCEHCRRGFGELPLAPDPSDRVYRRWIEWSYARRIELWDDNNRTTRARGGTDCLWIGMVSGDLRGECHSLRDVRAIAKRAEMLLLDSQTRSDASGFAVNAEASQRLKGVLGWDKPIAESMAMYQSGGPAFRSASKPAVEARLWMLEGIAGGLLPWWHFVGARKQDRRQLETPVAIYAWHAKNERYLCDRRPIAPVGIIWSQRSFDLHGADRMEEREILPSRGVASALLHARIPFVPVHADDIASSDARVLVVPNVGVLSDAQCSALRAFANAGGGLVVSGESARFDEHGEPRTDFALADVLGVHATGRFEGSSSGERGSWDDWRRHSYLRIGEPRHPIAASFDETEILPFGGRLEVVTPARGTVVPLTFVPPFPIYPPETAWMRQERTDVAACVLGELGTGGRTVYLAADIDRCYSRDHLPDHARLLENVVRWAGRDDLGIDVRGPGLLDCHLYAQADHLILHIVNLTSTDAWRLPADEVIPVGPIDVRLQLPSDVSARAAREHVTETDLDVTLDDGWIRFALPVVRDHAMVVIR